MKQQTVSHPQIMDFPVLTTKLNIPEPRIELVSRPRLTDILNQGKTKQVTLITAPAGYGKTTLLSDWISRQKDPVSWISLDKMDNNPKIFLAYLAASLRAVDESIVQGIDDSVHQNMITKIINNITEWSSNLIMVFEDYHVIHEKKIHEILEVIFQYKPKKIHIIIATRSDPPLSLARIRAQNQLNEIRVSDLYFTDQEATQFFEHAMRLKLDSETVKTLNEKTEGWIAGLQMAGLSMRGTEDYHHFVNMFTGDERHILDFLMEEVLNSQNEDTRDFLLKTSILEQLNGSLCDAVTNRHDSHKKLDQLEKQNLFIVPLDGKRQCFRYHHLFADLLRTQLQAIDQESIIPLHKRASDWLRDNGFRAEAIEHSLAAQDVENAVNIIMTTMGTMLQRGEIFKDVLDCVEALPKQVTTNNPFIRILHAWLLQVSMRIDKSEQSLNKIEQEMGNQLPDELKVQIAVIRANLARMKGQRKESLNLSTMLSKMLGDDISEKNISVQTSIAFNVTMTYLYIDGDLKNSIPWAEKTISLCEQASSTTLILASYAIRSNTYLLQGLMAQAIAICEKGQRLADRVASETGSSVPAMAYIWVNQADMKREKNQLNEAIPILDKAIAMCTQWDIRETLCDAYAVLALTLQELGETEAALEVLDKGELLQDMVKNVPRRTRRFTSYRIYFLLKEIERIPKKQSKLPDEIKQWVASKNFKTEIESLSAEREFEYLIWIRYLLINDQEDKVIPVLDELIRISEKRMRFKSVIEMCTLKAAALQKIGNIDEAINSLSIALKKAKTSGFVRVFLDEGEPINDLLKKMGPTNAFGKLLLHEFTKNRVLSTDPKTLDELSEREREVLRCIADGFSNQKISQALYISVNTVKTHLKNINSKLQVTNRSEALAKARKMELL